MTDFTKMSKEELVAGLQGLKKAEAQETPGRSTASRKSTATDRAIYILKHLTLRHGGKYYF